MLGSDTVLQKYFYVNVQPFSSETGLHVPTYLCSCNIVTSLPFFYSDYEKQMTFYFVSIYY